MNPFKNSCRGVSKGQKQYTMRISLATALITFLCTQGTQAHTPDAPVGLPLSEEEDLDQSYKICWKAARAGNAEAQMVVGLMYVKGVGIKADREEGAVLSFLPLAVMYHYGIGIQENEKEAAKWYKKAADAGISKAYGPLVGIYQDGSGVEKDEKEAERLFEKERNASAERFNEIAAEE